MTKKAYMGRGVLALLVLAVVAMDILMVVVGVELAFEFMSNIDNIVGYLVVQAWTVGYFGSVGFVNFKLYRKIFKK